MSSMSQESLLPMPVQASSEPRGNPGVYIPFPVFLYDAAARQYAVLPTSDGASDSDSEDGTVAGDEDPAQSKLLGSPPNNLEGMHISSPATRPSTFSWYRALSGTIWYMRMCLVLVILCTAATLATGAVFALIGNAVVLGSLAPYAAMREKAADSEMEACAVGAGVLGCAVGLCAFACFVVRRARLSDAERDTELELPAPASASASAPRRYEYPDLDLDMKPSEPEELWTALTVAAVAGVFAMAVGMAVVPGLRLAAAAEGFEVKHALAIGAWGLGAPLSPMLACMFVATLWKCDPCAGAECCCEGLGACCARD
ncbi:hypothetical protein L226DRAFT_573093 [Lentinus tigrinus ALCF2SS1-7]|uniref:uncharacterized protein n=1 Tax=Lentinus tigrinus ALCF2SS1-7 TaxID=1328758 RepID=UPI001165F864|nr:hypothetical protein L226DRAFT_573093 [Lentinus tigrinus ALCF2SS1-7]